MNILIWSIKNAELKLLEIYNQIKHEKMYLLRYIMIRAELENFRKNTVIENKKKPFLNLG